MDGWMAKGINMVEHFSILKIFFRDSAESMAWPGIGLGIPGRV